MLIRLTLKMSPSWCNKFKFATEKSSEGLIDMTHLTALGVGYIVWTTCYIYPGYRMELEWDEFNVNNDSLTDTNSAQVQVKYSATWYELYKLHKCY